MKQIDQDGILLCEIQAQIFKQSIRKIPCSSEVFLRRFLNSKIATELDSGAFLDDTKTTRDVYLAIEKEYGQLNYGTNRFDSEILCWMGYLYRYFSYTYELSSKQTYKLIKPKELKESYFTYCDTDPAIAIDKIMNEKGIVLKEENIFQRNLDIFRNIRL